MATTSYASVAYYFLHMASQRFNEAKYFIISHITCRYTCIKIHSSFSFIAVLFVPRLSEHERPGAIGMLKAGVRVSDVTWYYNCIPSTVQCLRDRYQATGTVKYQMQLWLTKMMTRRQDGNLRWVFRRYLHRRYPFQLATASASQTFGLWV